MRLAHAESNIPNTNVAMPATETVAGAVAGVLSALAKGGDPSGPSVVYNGSRAEQISLPGPDSISKTALERELSALVTRIQLLEARAALSNTQSLPATPNELNCPPQFIVDSPTKPVSDKSRLNHARHQSHGARDSQSTWFNNLINPRSSNGTDAFQREGEARAGMTHLTEIQASGLRDHVEKQESEIRQQKETIDKISQQLSEQTKHTAMALDGTNSRLIDIDSLKRELAKHQQANMAFSKALREIGNIVTAVADGDLSKKVLIHAKELDPEIGTFKKTINRMVDQLQDFATQVSHLAKEVGTEGRLGGEANLPDVKGIWAELTGNVNIMAQNLTDQVREIAVVTTAVAHGDLSKKIERQAKGEILQLQQTINKMVDNLRTFATEVTRVARDVGTEGVLGGQAQIDGVQGMWNDLTVNVNAMANNLTAQVRDIAKVTTAVAKGDLTQKVSATCKGEILDLKLTINSMVDQLQQFAHEVTDLAQDVGTEGRLGGQATVHGVEGTWRDLTWNVNEMANKLTQQVREIAEVTTAVARGDLSKKVTADVKGEILELKLTINSMVDRLGTFAFEVSKVAREVGTEGTLGGQAKVENVEGKWKDLTDNVNTMANNLTTQVRGISDVTIAISRGDLTKKIHVHARGEILLLKSTINDMVERLDSWSLAVKRVARDVGVDGKMGGQAQVVGITGRWKEITVDVNTMAQNLTSQVRAFADITNAANSGDFTQEITIAASGEMDELKRKINKMVSGLRESIEKNTKAREVAELANKTKSEFLANMSHEIRTPMNGIIGMTQLSLDSELTNPQRDMLTTVYQLANSLLTIIDDILDISKIEANRMDMERIPFSVRGTVYNALKSLVVRASDRNLNLAYEVDAETNDYIVGDSFRLRQIIINLVGNAIKFTESGEVKVKISSPDQSGCLENEYIIQFAVSDTGIGIHSDKLEVIFDTFQQADGSTTRRFGGTGLGLSISKRLVKLMGGNLWVESSYGHGSVFYFTCKYTVADATLRTIAPQLVPYRGHTVLFIDQDKTGCTEDICSHLTELGLVPFITTSLESMPKAQGANGHAYDCVLVDSNEMGRQIRKIEKFKYIPIVMLAKNVKVNFKSALEDGISSYMTTPCRAIDLGNAIIPALEGRATPLKNDHSRSFDILLAEDNQVNQKLAVKILQKYQHVVTVANNGQEAFDAIKAKRFDVVLMDVQMPIMGGFEATAKIREWEREARAERTPILALTAHAMLGDREKCLQAEMDDYLSKPLKQTQLIQCILKYATMSGAMLEHKRTSRRALTPGPAPASSSSRPSNAQLHRPGMERGFTEDPRALDSPAIVEEEKANPFDRLFLRSHSS